MNAIKSIDFTLNMRDMFEQSRLMRGKWRWRVRQTFLSSVLVLHLYLMFTGVFNPWLSVAFIYFTIELISPLFFVRLMIPKSLKNKGVPIHLAWNGEYIEATTRGNSQRMPWDLLAKFGHAEEYDDRIIITSGRGNMTPFLKRYFADASEWSDFHDLVIEKMGNRFRSQAQKTNEIVSSSPG